MQSSSLMVKHGTEPHTAHRHAGLIGATTTIVGPEGVEVWKKIRSRPTVT